MRQTIDKVFLMTYNKIRENTNTSELKDEHRMSAGKKHYLFYLGKFHYKEIIFLLRIMNMIHPLVIGGC